jgi:hypothetical protein
VKGKGFYFAGEYYFMIILVSLTSQSEAEVPTEVSGGKALMLSQQAF